MKIVFLSDLRKKRNTGFEIVKNLKNMGHEVYPLNIKGFFPNIYIKKILKTKKPDIIFTYKGVGNIDYKKIDYEFKKKILWYPDTDLFTENKFNSNLKDIFEFHDHIFIIVKSKVELLRKIFKKPHIYWMVQGARFYEYNIEKIPYKFVTHIGFIGSLKGKIYSSRRELLAKICEKFGNKYIIRIWGVKPDKRENFYSILNSFHTGRRIFFEEFKKAVMGSKIIVDIGSEESIREEGALSGKVFMITGCGGFLMIKYIKGVEEFFEIGKEIEIFNEHEEAFDKINYYLKNEEKRRKIAENARKRVLREHLYIHRLKKIFEICGI